MKFEVNTALGGDMMRKLMTLWSRLEEATPAQLESEIDWFIRPVAELVASRPYCVALSKRLSEPPPGDSLLGWRRVSAIYAADACPEVEALGEANLEALMNDPHVRQAVRGSGQSRVYRDQASAKSNTWGETLTLQILERTGVSDRMVGIYPVTPSIEVWMGVDAVDRPHFTEAEADLYLLAISSIARPLANIARLHGLLSCNSELTPRERETLKLLLKGCSEKSIAAQFELSTGYVHQCVVRIFRKFNVASRPELMAMWIGSPGQLDADP